MYGFDDGYEMTDADYHRMDFIESLAEDGRAWCDKHREAYEQREVGTDKHGYPILEDPGCPRCAKVEELRAAVECGEVEADAVCYACGQDVATAEVLDRPVCAQCYAALAEGRYRPDRLEFADPGGRSALRAAGPGNPRVLPCPTCGAANRLTPQDRARGYQCDRCADALERGVDSYC